MDDCSEASDYHEFFTIIDVKNLTSLINDDEEIDLFTMTSLNNILLGQNKSHDNSTGSSNLTDEEDDVKLKRLSLAYERLHCIPKILLHEMASAVRILDISYNEFTNLDFLKEFTELTSLICDHNNINSNTIFPHLPKLELLWMNHCKLTELYPWARNLQQSCPNLKYLSLMGNQAAPSYLNGGNFYEYLQYRFFIIALFPQLLHLDDRAVTVDQKIQARKMYQRPIFDRLLTTTQKNIPQYVRVFLSKCSGLFTPTPQQFASGVQRNGII